MKSKLVDLWTNNASIFLPRLIKSSFGLLTRYFINLYALKIVQCIGINLLKFKKSPKNRIFLEVKLKNTNLIDPILEVKILI
jgi:hypothetical protein